MSLGYRGKEIFKPLNKQIAIPETEGFYGVYYPNKKASDKAMILMLGDSSDDRLAVSGAKWIHVGAVERDSDGLFRHATLYLSEVENRYMTGEVRRKVIFGTYKLPMVDTDNKKVLLKDGDVFQIGDIRVEAIMVPGHTWGHMVYLIDDAYLFTGDTIWFGPDGGYSFIFSCGG